VNVALFEAKTEHTEISRAGMYFGNKLGIPFCQILYDVKAPAEYPGGCFKLHATSFLILAR
jgi:hypothetical protein